MDVISFDHFELDVRRGRLRKAGRPVRIQPKPLTILARLAARPGEAITREELRAALWPADTHVEFEAGLNTAMRKLRRALGDSAAHPRYVQTVPRVGYRFIGTISHDEARPPSSFSAPPRHEPALARVARSAGLQRIAALLALALCAAATMPARDARLWTAARLVMQGEQLVVTERFSVGEAAHMFEEGVTAAPELAIAWGWIALAEARIAFTGTGADARSRYARAYAAATRALAAEPRSWTAHAAVAYVRDGRDADRDAASAAFERAVNAGARDPRVYIDYACLLKKAGRHALALQTIEEGLRQSPRSAALHAHRGLHLHSVGRYEQELSALREAVTLNPLSPEVQFHLGLAYARRGQYPQSVSALQLAVELSHGAPLYRSWLERIEADADVRHQHDRLSAGHARS